MTIHNEESKTSNFEEISNFLKDEGIEFGKFLLNGLARELARLDTLTEEQRETLIQSYPDLIEKHSSGHGYRHDVICLYPEFEHLQSILMKFKDVHFHYENEYWYFIDGSFGFVFLGSHGRKYELLVEAGEYLQVPEGKWQYLKVPKIIRMKTMRFFNTTYQFTVPSKIIFKEEII